MTDNLTSLLAFEQQIVWVTDRMDSLLRLVSVGFQVDEDDTLEDVRNRWKKEEVAMTGLRTEFRGQMGDLLLRAVAVSQDVIKARKILAKDEIDG